MAMLLDCGCEVADLSPRPHIRRACEQHGRISLRDHFAGQALAGLAHAHVQGTATFSKLSAEQAYAYADAMLAQRETGSR